MASFAIGDVHGCYKSLIRLLEVIEYQPGADTIWLVGDLVNRGPASLAVTRWAAGSAGIDSILGNHDLYLLACAHGVTEPRERDSLDEFLGASDRGQLVDWLLRRPLIAECENQLIVHAGLLPQWTIETAKELAADVENQLRGPGAADFLKQLFEDRNAVWDPRLDSRAQTVAAAQAFTRLRTCRPDGVPCFDFTGPPEAAPHPCRPWYQLRQADETSIVFGHWAALGYRRLPNSCALDSGCGWGGELTALRLDDGQGFWVENLDFASSSNS